MANPDSLLKVLLRRLTSHSGVVFLLGFILIFSLWLFVWQQITDDYDNAIEDATRETMNLVIGFEEHVRRIIAGADKSLLKIRKVYEREGLSSPAVDDLLAIDGNDASGIQVAIDDDQGITQAAFDKRAIGNDISDREYFQFHRDTATDALYIGQPVVGKASGAVGIPVTRRFNNPDGSFGGIVLIALKSDYFLNYYEKVDLGQDQLIGLYGLDGFIRARQSNGSKSYGQDISNAVLWEYIQTSPAGTYIASASLDGIQRIVSYRVMPDYPLVIAVGKSVRVSLTGYEQRKHGYILGAVLASLFILVFCYVIVNRHTLLQRQHERLQAVEGELLAHNEELQAKEEELLAQNEELQAQEEELLVQNEELQAKEEELMAQNEELQVKEAALFNSRERYRALLAQMSEGIIIYGYPAMNIIETNDNATSLFGYPAEELLSMNFTELHGPGLDNIQSVISDLLATRKVLPQVHSFRHRDGYLFYAEIAASLIEHQGETLIILSYRDITASRKLQEQIQKDVAMGGRVQQVMLPGDYEDEKVIIRTAYEPFRMISGDNYGYKWVRGGSLLNGFLIDVTGHGMATALQTAAVSTLLYKEIEKDQPWTQAALAKLNMQFAAYLPEHSYAAVLAFSFDFAKRLLTCVSAGINHFIASCQHHHDWIALPGSFLGNPDFGRFESMSIPLQHGDVFCFPTDGLFERLVPEQLGERLDFGEIVAEMRRRAAREDKVDDCTMLCLTVKAFPSYPVSFEYAGRKERKRVLHRVWQALAKITGRRDFASEVALGEAETNAFRYGGKVRIKLNRIGHRLILRVFSDGPGFTGNEAVKKIQATGITATLKASLPDEHGRGIPLMLAMMDQVLYNRRGNEVMLVKDLTVCKKAARSDEDND